MPAEMLTATVAAATGSEPSPSQELVLAEAATGSEPPPSQELLANATLDHFSICLVAQLKAYCRVRLNSTESPALLNLKKGSVREAMAGVQNLIFLAHSFRQREISLSMDEEPVADGQEVEQVSASQPSVRRHSIQGTVEKSHDDFTFFNRHFVEGMFSTFTLPEQRPMELADGNDTRFAEEACKLI